MNFEYLECGAAVLERSTGVVRECNSRFTKFTYAAVGQNFWEKTELAMFEDSRQKMYLKIEAVGTEGTRVVEVRTQVVEEGNGLFVEVRDMTKQEETEQRVSTFLELSFDGFWDWHIKDDYEYMSPRFWEMFGYDHNEMQPKPSEWQKIVFPEDLQTMMHDFTKHVKSKGAVPFRSEIRYRHKNGSTVIVCCAGRVIDWDSNGKPLRAIGTHTDVTELRRQAKIETERRIGDFLAHGIRNPLTSAVSSNMFLREQLANVPGIDSALAKQIYSDSQMVHDNLIRISELIGHIGELRKIHDHTISINCAVVDDIAEEILNPLKSMFETEPGILPNGVRITIEGTESPIKAIIDPLRFKQVVFEITTCLAQELGDGDCVHITPSSGLTAGYLTVVIEDTGPPFNSGDDLQLGGMSDGVTNDYDLASCGDSVAKFLGAKALVGAMHGTLTANAAVEPESRQTPGNRIVLNFPLKPFSQESLAEVTMSKKPLETQNLHTYYHGCRCLVIDDNRMIRKILTRRLKSLVKGAIVDCAESGEEGIRLARQHAYRFIIVDHYMPGKHSPLNGAETICQLRLLGVTAPIVGCSGNDVSFLHLKAGADWFIQKPTPLSEKFIEIMNALVPRNY